MQPELATALVVQLQLQTGTALDTIDLGDPVTIAAPLVALIASIGLTYSSAHLGDDTRFWRAVRSLLPYVDAHARDRGFYTTYEIGAEEIAGYWEGSLSELEATLRSIGMQLGPLAAHKSLDANEEVGSWIYLDRNIRDAPAIVRLLWKLLYPYQIHVTIFKDADTDSDRYIVTAHREYSAYSPLYAYWHLRATKMDVEAGITFVQEAIGPADRRFAPEEHDT